MGRWILQVLMMSCLFINTACAENAKSPVDPVVKDREEGAAEEEDHLKLMSLVYEGIDHAAPPFGDNKCSFSLALVESESHEGDEHGHALVAHLNYKVHGVIPRAAMVSEYRYDPGQRKFFPKDSTEPNTHPTLVSIIVNDEDAKVDPNKQGEYEANKKKNITPYLIQSLRTDLKVDVDMEAFEESMEEVLEDTTKFAAHKAALNQLNRVAVRFSHGTHYDGATCSDLQLKRVEELEYELDKDHDDDDHDDDHDDHDHDH